MHPSRRRSGPEHVHVHGSVAMSTMLLAFGVIVLQACNFVFVFLVLQPFTHYITLRSKSQPSRYQGCTEQRLFCLAYGVHLSVRTCQLHKQSPTEPKCTPEQCHVHRGNVCTKVFKQNRTASATSAHHGEATYASFSCSHRHGMLAVIL